MTTARLKFLFKISLSCWAIPLTAQEEKKADYVPTTEAAANALLGQRMDGGFGETFRDFANMFVVQSNISLGSTVGLMTSDKEIMGKQLMPVFPESYQPTLREFLDSIALQTSSAWKHDTSGKYVKNQTDSAVTKVTIFEFSPVEREKPFTMHRFTTRVHPVVVSI